MNKQKIQVNTEELIHEFISIGNTEFLKTEFIRKNIVIRNGKIVWNISWGGGTENTSK